MSVVVPSFNQARHLREALDSILSQDHPGLEVLVMDGGSTDGSVEILRGYGDRIAFVSERDRGQSDAINRGFARARGEIVAWLNSDDRYLPGAVRAAASALAARPDAGMVYGDGELIDEDGHVLGPFAATQPFDLWTLVHVSDFIMQPTVFMRADAVREAGGLDESLRYGMDWDLWIRLACRRPVLYLEKMLAQTREYATTKTATGGWRRLQELRSIMACHGATGWPPGARAYGLDTLRLRFPTLFGPSSLGDARAQEGRWLPRLCRPLHRSMARLISRQNGFPQGIWPDSWMAREGHRAVPWRGEAGVVRVQAELPPEPELLPFTLDVHAEGRRVRSVRAEPGRFEVRVPLEAADARPRALEVVLRASRCHRFPWDPRSLSCRIHDVAFEPAG